MATDHVYELCLPVLQDDGLDEEEKTDKLEELLRKETTLSGRPLEEAVLGALWRHRDSKPGAELPSPARPTLGSRRNSPAPWQIPRASTPLASPPLTGASPATSGITHPGLSRTKSSTISPYTSPRPSPRLTFASPIPHSPNLSTYQFSDPHSHPADDYGDYGSDTVDWLVNDESPSRPSSAGGMSATGSTLSATAPVWQQPQEAQMSPYEMLRSVMGDTKTDDEIESALANHDYDLSATLVALMAQSGMYEDTAVGQDGEGKIIVGKSMLSTPPISIRAQPQSTDKSTVPCKYWLQTGQCLRADCRFSHDLTGHICKYWMMGNCLAGDSCLFSHDPAALMEGVNINGDSSTNSPQGPSFQVQDYDAFPTLQPGMNWAQSLRGSAGAFSPGGRSAAGSFTSTRAFMGSPRSQGSRPTSRHSSRPTTPSHLSFNDEEAFPTLGSGSKPGKKHHGKRGGHGHGPKEPNSMADVVRMSPGPSPSLLRKGLVKSRSYMSGNGSAENSAAAKAISEPKHIPWLETGEKVNQTYIKARQDAFKHGGLRNKFLQSAAQAWNRNDTRAAKALSLRGQSENELMRKAHREAARILYDSRNKDPAAADAELYVDLHGLHPEEAVEYLERVLLEQQKSSRPVYAITGTGHHSKNGKDKVGKAVRQWLVEWKYAFREFSVPGDRGNMGGILGVDARSFDKSMLGKTKDSKDEDIKSGEDTKVKVIAPIGPKLKT